MDLSLPTIARDRQRHAAPQVYEALRERIKALDLAPGTVLPRADLALHATAAFLVRAAHGQFAFRQRFVLHGLHRFEFTVALAALVLVSRHNR